MRLVGHGNVLCVVDVYTMLLRWYGQERRETGTCMHLSVAFRECLSERKVTSVHLCVCVLSFCVCVVVLCVCVDVYVSVYYDTHTNTYIYTHTCTSVQSTEVVWYGVC